MCPSEARVTKAERLKYERLRRVRNFVEHAANLFPDGSPGQEAMVALNDAIAEIDTLYVRKLSAEGEMRRSSVRSRAALISHMKSITKTARALGIAGAGTSKRFRMPTSESHAALANAARSFLDDTALFPDLARMGMRPAFLADMRGHLEAFEEATAARRTGRARRAAAQAGLNAAFARAFRALHTLDVVISNVVHADTVLLGVWKWAYRAPKPSKPRKRVVPQA